jgi:hypothetical protein
MPKADCVHSTPPTDASKSTVGAPSAGQSSPLSLIPATALTHLRPSPVSANRPRVCRLIRSEQGAQ